jgi:hypothetical protein
LGSRLSHAAFCDLLEKMIGKLKSRGLLITANTLDLPERIPESVITRRPIIESYYIMLARLATPISNSSYIEEKLGRMYEYQVWGFQKK